MCKSDLAAFILLLSIIVLSGCQDRSNADEARLKGDIATLQRLEQINKAAASSKTIPPDDFAFVKETYSRYPNSESARRVLKNALVVRQDWEALITLLGETSKLVQEDQITLASAYFKTGEFETSLKILESLQKNASASIEATSLMAHCFYSLGQSGRTISLLEPIIDSLISEKRVDDLNVLGLAMLQDKKPDAAIYAFEHVRRIDPEDPWSTNGLSRAYYAKGDLVKAEEFRELTERAQIQLTTKETRSHGFVQQSYQLESAWKEKRYEEAIRIARQLIPISDAKNKPVLYKYLIESYKALGRISDAEAAAAEASVQLGK